MLARNIIVLLPLVATTLASPLIIETRSDPRAHGALSPRGSRENAAQQGYAKRGDDEDAYYLYGERGDGEDPAYAYPDEDAAKTYGKRGDGEDPAYAYPDEDAAKTYGKRGADANTAET